MHFHYTGITYMRIHHHMKISSVCHEIFIFGRPVFGNHYYVFSLSDLVQGLQRNNVVSLYYLVAQEPLSRVS